MKYIVLCTIFALLTNCGVELKPTTDPRTNSYNDPAGVDAFVVFKKDI
jgi:hypothetical protein